MVLFSFYLILFIYLIWFGNSYLNVMYSFMLHWYKLLQNVKLDFNKIFKIVTK